MENETAIKQKIMQQCELGLTLPHYFVSLLREGLLMGSGTLVSCNEKHGILTAYHVVHRKGNQPFDFTIDSKQVLNLVLDEAAYDFGIPMRYLVCHDIGIPVSDKEGPDISFLEIPPGDALEVLKAKKSFLTIEKEWESKLECCRKGEFPQRWLALYSIPHKDKDTISAWMGFTAADKYGIANEFDFVEISADYKENNLPASFGGASGGGLWRIPGVCVIDKKFKCNDCKPVFGGVLFYETDIENQRRYLRCNGPLSIYVKVRQVLSAKHLS